MKIGFGKVDITPRVGVELAGFGPFLNRHSIAVRDRLWSRAMAVERDGQVAVLVSNDIISLYRHYVERIRELVHEATGLAPEQVMVHCTHTHSGPVIGTLNGWGDPDYPYLELLPGRIAQAAIEAVGPARASASTANGTGTRRRWRKCCGMTGAQRCPN